MSDSKKLVIYDLLSRLQHVKTQYENIEAKVRRRFHAIEKFSLRNAFVINFFFLIYIFVLYHNLQLILAYSLSISRPNYLAAKKSFLRLSLMQNDRIYINGFPFHLLFRCLYYSIKNTSILFRKSWSFEYAHTPLNCPRSVSCN